MSVDIASAHCEAHPGWVGHSTICCVYGTRYVRALSDKNATSTNAALARAAIEEQT